MLAMSRDASNLGSFLNLLFINELLCSDNCETLVLADDALLFYKVNSVQRCLLLQDNHGKLDEPAYDKYI